MRTVRHLIGALMLLVVLLVGALAFVLYDPLSGGRRWLKLSEMLTAPVGKPPTVLLGGEPPIEQSDPAGLASLALRYQPTLVVSGLDRFWPVSVISLLSSRWQGHDACVFLAGRCQLNRPGASVLDAAGSRADFLSFPTPIDSVADTFLSVGQAVGIPLRTLEHWPHDLAAIAPFRSAQIYFYYLSHVPPSAYPGTPRGLVSLEYWFYYPLNYFPLLRIPLQALADPIGSTIGNTDYHQGDFEHVAVLLDAGTMQPRYLWMARHADEGVAYPWHSRSVQWDGEHPVIYAALGSHASYARCGIQRRSRTYWFINDYVVCEPHQDYAFGWRSTPLVDLAKTNWGCWRGHLGRAGSGLFQGDVGFVEYETPGPFSPLLQAENFGRACRVAAGTPKPKPAL